MLRAILFDVDGTLVDTNDLHATAWREAFRHFGIDIPFEAVRAQIGKGGDNLLPALLPALGEAEHARIEKFRSELFRRDYLPRAVPFPGIRPLFEQLAGDGVAIVLASSSDEAEVEYHLGLTGAADLVTAFTSRSDVEHSKPCPDIFAAALEMVRPATRDECLVIGDSPYDIEAAAKLGLAAIGVRCGGFADEALRVAGAAALFNGPSHLLAEYEAWTNLVPAG